VVPSSLAMVPRFGATLVLALALSPEACASPASSSPETSETPAAVSNVTAAAPLPVDAGAKDASDAAPPGPCSSVVVGCAAQLGYASSDRKACRLELSPTMCAELGLTVGASLDPKAVLALPFPSFPTPVALYDFCATKHEARHTLDDSPYLRNCESEVAAYDVSVACLRDYQSSHCGVPGAPAWCDHLPGYVAGGRASRELNACLCRASTTCAACLEECDDDSPSVANVCSEAARAYCAVNGK